MVREDEPDVDPELLEPDPYGDDMETVIAYWVPSYSLVSDHRLLRGKVFAGASRVAARHELIAEVASLFDNYQIVIEAER